MKLTQFIIIFFYASNVLALGGRGPLELNKDGLKNKPSVVLNQIGIDEHLGDKIDLTLPFVDDQGNSVALSNYFNSSKPVFLVLNYYNCPTLCNTHLNQIISRLKDFEWKIGSNFNFVVVSIDPNETPKDASKRKEQLLGQYGDHSVASTWHFLTGPQASISALATQIGFKYAWEPREKQWAHAAASYVLTPAGVISYYHYGIDIEPKVFKLSLIEASEEKIGTILDRMVLFCLQYDPNKKTYAFYAYNLMKVGAILMALVLGLYLFNFWRKENKTQI